MNKRKFLFVIISLVAVIILSLPSCEKPLFHLFKIRMVNGASMDVHMWTVGESIDPSNKLSQGSSRTVDAKIERIRDRPKVTFKVYVGQNGQTLTSKSFETDAALVSVRYSGGNLTLE